MSKRTHIITLLLIAALLPATAQTSEEKQQLRRQRFSKIDYWHAGVGLDAGFNQTFTVGPRLFAGFGTHRNLLTADAGVKLLWLNPVGSASKERVSQRQLPVFAQVGLNLLRWQHNALYVGGEAAYHLQLGASHYLPEGEKTETDDNLAKNHASLSARIGLRLGRWDVALSWQRDLAPAFSQQYVYESFAYDYDQLHDTLFERSRFGITLSYLFPF